MNVLSVSKYKPTIFFSQIGNDHPTIGAIIDHLEDISFAVSSFHTCPVFEGKFFLEL